MLQKGDISSFLPRATGEWEKDKKRFIAFQTEIEKLADLTDVDLE